MNRKIFFLSTGIIIFFTLFYFPLGTCSGHEGTKDTIIGIHYDRGMMYYKEGKYDWAVKEFQKVLEIEPAHKKAKKYLTEAVNRNNKNILEQLCTEAKAFYKQKEYQKSLDTYQKALEIKPGDGYISYQMVLVRDKIERSKALGEDTRSKLKQSKKELERIAKEREKKERLLKKQLEVELNKEEKEEKRKERGTVKENRENKIISVQTPTLEKRALKTDSVILPKNIEQDTFLSEKIKELEGLYRIKFLFELGEKYYNEEEYHRAIETFQQVIDLEANNRIFYAPYAENYIYKAKEKLQEQKNKERIKEIEDMENEMINKAIDSKIVYPEGKQ